MELCGPILVTEEEEEDFNLFVQELLLVSCIHKQQNYSHWLK
jgi:hypothetical protein